MKILMVTPLLPNPRGMSAGAIVMYGQLMACAAGHEVTLATFAGPDPAEQAAIDQLRVQGIDVQPIWRTEPTGRARWRRRRRLATQWLHGRHPLRALEFWEPAMQQLLDRLLRESRFDLLQVEDTAMANYAYKGGIPAVLTDHEVRAPGDQQLSGGPRRALREAEWRRWRRYQPAVWRRFDRIQVFTPRDAEAIRAMSPMLSDRVRVNPFGVELPAELEHSYEEHDTLVFIGAFAHPPNVDAAVWLGREIMPLLRAQGQQARLTIVGDQPPQAVRALAGKDILVTGRVPSVEPFLGRAAVVVAPLRAGGGMRLKVLQAMAYGKAVVTTPLGAEGIAVGSCPPPVAIGRDAAEIACETAALLADDAARHTLGQRARAFVAAHHSRQLYRRRLESIYAELSSRRMPSSP